ncbi:MAG TPA: hypothetical protein DCQ50_00060 [Chryseobacterium sp.]|nr:hypothetical protein [Chryseobacterium sp.]
MTKKIPIKYLFNKTMICCITYEKQFQELFPAFATRFFEVSATALPPPKPQKELRHAAQSGLKYRSAILTFSVKYLNSGIYYLQHS